MLKPLSCYYPKDFIETAEDLLFAVVACGTEEGKVLCFLRYARQENRWQKHNTEQANQLLQQYYPDYQYYSTRLDAHLHAVPITKISKHYQPKQQLQQFMQTPYPDNIIEQQLLQLVQLLQLHGLDITHFGITGSILIGMHNEHSDIDLVCYQRNTFHQCRQLIAQLIEQNNLQALSEEDWQASWQRRDSMLNFNDYVWHEQRKNNKAMIHGRKFDISFIDPDVRPSPVYQKKGMITLQCRVLDDTYAYDYPAQFIIDHPDIQSIVSFTATYNGQAVRNELIEVAGMLETSEDEQRIVVGSSREAAGQYIKVIQK